MLLFRSWSFGSFITVFFSRCQRYLSPLKKEQASKCLKQFLFRIATALNELHAKYEIAHLDVRIPNICFLEKNNTFQVVLIDLDRHQARELSIDTSV